MLEVDEWVKFDEIDIGKISTDPGIYEFWIESDSVSDGKHYYGQAKNLQNRFKTGYYQKLKDPENPRTHSKHLNNAVRVHGTTNLYYRIRSIIPKSSYNRTDLGRIENRYIIAGLNNDEYLLNATSGGEDGDWYDYKTEEERWEFRLNAGRTRTSTGILYVYKNNLPSAKKGYNWRYVNPDWDVDLSCSTLPKLEERVKSEGYLWEVLDKEKADNSYKEDKEIEETLPKGLITNTTGVQYVSKNVSPMSKKGFFWRYHNKDVTITRSSFKELEKVVKFEGHEWPVVDDENYLNSLKEDEELDVTLYKGRKDNTSGIEYVSKQKDTSMKKNFSWIYRRTDQDIKISRTSLKDLRTVVKVFGLEWNILDPEKAKKSLEEDEKLKETLYRGLISNTSGINGVSKSYAPSNKKGYGWRYRNQTLGVAIYASTLNNLEEKVKSEGYPWEVLDPKKAKKTYEEDEAIEKSLYKGLSTNTSGIQNVFKKTTKKTKKGYTWVFKTSNKEITNVNLKKLEDKVKSEGFEWTILDPEKAKKTYEEDEAIEKTLYKGRKSNTSGIEYVSKFTSDSKKGYSWTYDNSKINIKFTRTSLIKLKEEADSKGYPWEVLDPEKAKKSFEEDEAIEKITYNGRKDNSSGILNVNKKFRKNREKSFWVYRDRKNHVEISRSSLKDLKEKVKSEGYPWVVLDPEKAKKSFEEDYS